VGPEAQALNFNAGDQTFQGRGLVSARADLLSEFDAIWRRDFGIRVSAPPGDPFRRLVGDDNTFTADDGFRRRQAGKDFERQA